MIFQLKKSQINTIFCLLTILNSSCIVVQQPTPPVTKSSSPSVEVELSSPTPKPTIMPSPTVFPKPIASPSQSASPVESLKNLAKKLQIHFEGSPIQITRLSARESAFNVDSYEAVKYQILSNASYDVRETNSLVTPYTGIIQIQFAQNSNDLCGDLVMDLNDDDSPVQLNDSFSIIKTYSSSAKAASKKDDNSCYSKSGAANVSFKVSFKFSYQDNNWILKSIDEENGYLIYLPDVFEVSNSSNARSINPENHINQTEKEAYEINKKWVDILKE